MTTMPPKHRPRPALPPKHYPRDLELCFAADPFDKRFIRGETAAGKYLTALGALVNVWYTFKRNGPVPPQYRAIVASLRILMERECPDTLAELEVL